MDHVAYANGYAVTSTGYAHRGKSYEWWLSVTVENKEIGRVSMQDRFEVDKVFIAEHILWLIKTKKTCSVVRYCTSLSRGGFSTRVLPI